MCFGGINHSLLVTPSPLNRCQGPLTAPLCRRLLCCVSSVRSDKAAGRGPGAGSASQVSGPVTWLDCYLGHNDRAGGGWPPWHNGRDLPSSLFQPPSGRRREALSSSRTVLRVRVGVYAGVNKLWKVWRDFETCCIAQLGTKNNVKEPRLSVTANETLVYNVCPAQYFLGGVKTQLGPYKSPNESLRWRREQ